MKLKIVTIFLLGLVVSGASVAQDLDYILSRAEQLYATGKSTNYINHAMTTIESLQDFLKDHDEGTKPLFIIDLEVYSYQAVLLYRDFFKGCLFPREGSDGSDHLSERRQRIITRKFIKSLSRETESITKVYVVPKSKFLSEKMISPCSMVFEDRLGGVLIMQGTTTLDTK